jgi:hypothetical protein
VSRDYWFNKEGLGYDARYAKYLKEYLEYEKWYDAMLKNPTKYLDPGEEIPKKVRRIGSFHGIKCSKTIPEQMAELDDLRRQGRVRNSPTTMVAQKGFFPWATDAVHLLPDKTFVCHQAALVLATASSLQDLGIEHEPVPSNNRAATTGASFKGLNDALPYLSPFELRKVSFASALDVFRAREGVYIIHTEVTDREDCDVPHDETETIPHYVVFNAGTRVLFCLPEVVVIDDHDLDDMETSIVDKLRQEPYCLRFPVRQGNRVIRQVWLRNNAHATRFPFVRRDLLPM